MFISICTSHPSIQTNAVMSPSLSPSLLLHVLCLAPPTWAHCATATYFLHRGQLNLTAAPLFSSSYLGALQYSKVTLLLCLQTMEVYKGSGGKLHTFNTENTLQISETVILKTHKQAFVVVL
jgi:hypothetical protein